MRHQVKSLPPIETYGTLVRLHKVLKGEDVYRAEKIAAKTGARDVCNPEIVIDFKYVTSIQKDYKEGGTVILDAKTACVVMEPLEEVLEAWRRVKEFLGEEAPQAEN